MGVTLFAILGLGILIWFWSDNLRAREQALAASDQACTRMSAQLLDQTVALTGFRLSGVREGRLRLVRVYGFEFCTDGASRFRGRAVLSGHRLEYVYLDHPDGGTVIDSPRTRVEA